MPGMEMPGIDDMDAQHATVTAALATKHSAAMPISLRWPAPTAQPCAYSSCRFHQMPSSLRPLGARSSHWYMLHRPSSPRA